MVDWDRREFVFISKEIKQVISFVMIPCRNTCICISSNKQERVGVLFYYIVNSILESHQLLHEVVFPACCAEIHGDMNAGLVARLLEYKDKNATTRGLKYGDVGIKMFLPHCQSATMGSRFYKREQIIMAIFRIKIETILVTKNIESKRSIRKVEPRFGNEDEGWILILYDFKKIEFITIQAFYIPNEVLYNNVLMSIEHQRY